LGLAAGWLSGLAGAWVARSAPGISSVPNVTPAPFAVAYLAACTAVAYLALAWAANHWHTAIAEGSRAAEAADAAETEAHQAAARLRALVEQSPLPTLAFGMSGKVEVWSPAAESFLGWSAAQAIGMHVSELVPDRARPEIEKRLANAADGHLAGPRLAVFVRNDGSEVKAEIYDAIERDADGMPRGVVVQFLDVTEREVMALRLAEAQRLEAVGQLAGGVAHDFNNSLTAIAGFASLIASGDSPDPREDARTILIAAEHAATLTRQLLAFSRRVPLRPQLTDLGQFLVQVKPLVRSLVGETIDVRLEAGTQPALVEVDQPSLEQAILNLASNARDAMPQGGELTFAVRSYPNCLAEGAGEPHPHVCVAVSDTGAGIDAGSIDRIFEPFFTTKPAGKGTGLGLAMVHGFAAQSGGHVEVSSPPGRGATIEVHFPLAVGLLAQAGVRAEPVGGTDSILFVEDDPGVASFGLACLRRLGYDVTPVMHGSEAVALAASRSEPFDLLFTDVVIPGTSGPELAALIHQHHPGTAILYASGYGTESVIGIGSSGGVELLEKPYSLDQLASKVREVLDARKGRRDAQRNGQTDTRSLS
jgi:PAS domain S-box-containing protein